jgi:hypothetical protein
MYPHQQELFERRLLDLSQTEPTVYEPDVAQTRGRPRGSSKRVPSAHEIHDAEEKKRKRKCGICRLPGHYRAYCPKKNEYAQLLATVRNEEENVNEQV